MTTSLDEYAEEAARNRKPQFRDLPPEIQDEAVAGYGKGHPAKVIALWVVMETGIKVTGAQIRCAFHDRGNQRA